MFQNAYQNGAYFEILDPKTSHDKVKDLYKMQNVPNNNKVFDKYLKSFIFEFNHPQSKIIFPRQQKKQLYLIQQFLNLQICFMSALDWNIQITVNDLSRTKRRIIISPSFHKIQKKPFFVKFPYALVKEGVWSNFSIDLYSFIEAFKGQTYRSLDMIQITGNFKLRRIFTTHSLIPQLSQQQKQSVQLLPKNICFPLEIQYQNMLIIFQQDLLAEQSHSHTQIEKSRHDVASSTNTRKEIVSKKSIKEIKQQKPEQKKPIKSIINTKQVAKSITNIKQDKSHKQIRQTKQTQNPIQKQQQNNPKSRINNKQKGYANQKKFLANTNGLEIIRNKKQVMNSSDKSKQKISAQVKTPLSVNKNSKKRQPLAKTQIPKLKDSSKQNSIKQNQERQKEKQKLNPWRSSNKKNNSTGRYQSDKIIDERKVQSAETSLFKTRNNLVEMHNQTKFKDVEKKSDCYSDQDYVQLSHKFSTVTAGRFTKNNDAGDRNSYVINNKLTQQKSHDQIQQNIQVEANSYYENSDKKDKSFYKDRKGLELSQKPIQQSINDSLDVFNRKNNKVSPKLQGDYTNMELSQHFGFGQKMISKFTQQLQRPYSPPLGQRQHNQDQQTTREQYQDKQMQLIYDPVLNCYYDHKTHTYYELKN